MLLLNNMPTSSHPDILEIIKKGGSFASYAIARRSFDIGALIATVRIPKLTLSESAYSTLQVGYRPGHHIEFDDDFLYIDHSCDPTLEYHISNPSLHQSDEVESATGHEIVIEIRVAYRRDAHGNAIGLSTGEKLTFFYPSTEWDMKQPFECLCGTSRCLGYVQGARYVPESLVFGSEYFFNDHILHAKRQQTSESGETKEKVNI